MLFEILDDFWLGNVPANLLVILVFVDFFSNKSLQN